VDEQSRRALSTDRVIDITTIGRASGQPRRKEMWFHNIDGKVYITGTPGARDWYANMVAHPEFTFHLKESTTADLPARARPITDADERHTVLTALLAKLGRSPDQVAEWEEQSPLVEVTFDDA